MPHAAKEPEAPEDLAAKLTEVLAADRTGEALEILGAVHPADAADLLESLDDDSLARVVAVWQPEAAAEALGELEQERQAKLAERIPSEALADILDVMPPDVAAAFLEQVEPERRARILGRMEREEASEVAELLEFPEESAGRLMSPDFVAVGEDSTVEEVIETLRKVPEDIELIYYVYVLGGSEQLKGIVSLRKLLTADPKTPVGELMETDIASVSPTDDRETAAELVRRYDLLAIPVTDEFGRMLGIVTVDDLLGTIGEEAKEDVLRFAGLIEPEEEVAARVWPALRRRLPWLAAATVIEIAIAYLLLRPFRRDLLLLTVAYIPLLLFVGGNTAVQAAARVLVRLESGRTETWSPWIQAGKELRAGLILALLAAGLSLPILLLLGRRFELSAVVAVALAGSVVVGAGLGATLPVVLKRLRMDPAIASGPLLGSAMDVASLSIYLTLASAFSRFLG